MIDLMMGEGGRFDRGVLDRFPEFGEFAASVGNTPIIEVPTGRSSGAIFAKAEWTNPCRTIKDRVAVAMLWAALSDGLDPKREVVLEYSGGQLSVALAKLCSLIGARCLIVLSESTPSSLVGEVMDAGGQVELVPKHLGFWGVMERARELKSQHPGYRFLYQHANPANVEMHSRVTGEEILRQLSGTRIDAWLAAIGTGGTLAGVASRLRRPFPDLGVYGVTPAELPYGASAPPNGLPKFSGSGGLGCGRKQQFVEQIESLVAGHFHIPYDDARREMHRFRQETGVAIGSSAAANLLAAKAVAERLGPGSTVVTVFPSAGSREEWEAIEGDSALHAHAPA